MSPKKELELIRQQHGMMTARVNKFNQIEDNLRLGPKVPAIPFNDREKNEIVDLLKRAIRFVIIANQELADLKSNNQSSSKEFKLLSNRRDFYFDRAMNLNKAMLHYKKDYSPQFYPSLEQLQKNLLALYKKEINKNLNLLKNSKSFEAKELYYNQARKIAEAEMHILEKWNPDNVETRRKRVAQEMQNIQKTLRKVLRDPSFERKFNEGKLQKYAQEGENNYQLYLDYQKQLENLNKADNKKEILEQRMDLAFYAKAALERTLAEFNNYLSIPERFGDKEKRSEITGQLAELNNKLQTATLNFNAVKDQMAQALQSGNLKQYFISSLKVGESSVPPAEIVRLTKKLADLEARASPNPLSQAANSTSAPPKPSSRAKVFKSPSPSLLSLTSRASPSVTANSSKKQSPFLLKENQAGLSSKLQKQGWEIKFKSIPTISSTAAKCFGEASKKGRAKIKLYSNGKVRSKSIKSESTCKAMLTCLKAKAGKTISFRISENNHKAAAIIKKVCAKKKINLKLKYSDPKDKKHILHVERIKAPKSSSKKTSIHL